MSIKLSIKDLKDLLKINKQAIKRKRRRNKRLIKNTIDNNYNKSSSDHMKSTGFTNTSNEATELIRLQRQALEDKLKNDKENKIKSDNDQLIADKEGGLVVRNPLQNAGGSNNLRGYDDELNKNVRYLLMTNNYNQYAQSDGPLKFPAHGSAPNKEPKNAINDVFSEKGPANIKEGFIDDEPTPPFNTNQKVEEIKEVEEVEEKPFDPSKINLSYAKKGQLLGYILHFDKNQTENAHIDMKASELKIIANKIKNNLLLKKEAEAKAVEAENARQEAEIEATAKAQLAAEARKDVAEAKIARAKAKIIADEADAAKALKTQTSIEAAAVANKKVVKATKTKAIVEAAAVANTKAKIKADKADAAEAEAVEAAKRKAAKAEARAKRKEAEAAKIKEAEEAAKIKAAKAEAKAAKIKEAAEAAAKASEAEAEAAKIKASEAEAEAKAAEAAKTAKKGRQSKNKTSKNTKI
jgi:hypothetical protein